ncbi:MAG TPA: LptF/LptG family permease [Pirellulales bacterium]|nr:LptF/LptG family permease [Pirellulales bacterium]
MTILDRYLLQQFLQNFLICFCSLAGLYIVIDAFGYLDSFIRAAGEHGSLWAIMGEYYGYQTIGFFDRTSGILTLVAAMFTISLFQRYNEMTALQAAGIRKWRIIKPLVAAILVFTALAVVNREVVIASPAVRSHLRTGLAQDLKGETAVDMIPRTDNKTGIILRGKQTVAKEQCIEKPAFALPAELDDYGRQLTAAKAFYQPCNTEHPNGYLLKGVTLPKSIASKPTLSLDGEPVILTPHDYPWLAPDDCFVVSGITFEYLAGADDWRRNASLPELVAGLHNPSLNLGSDVRVAMHARVVQPVLDVVLLFLGLPLLLSRYNRNVFFAIGLCVALVVGFYLVIFGCQYLGSNYLINPSLAAWLPLMIFVPLAFWMSEPLRE